MLFNRIHCIKVYILANCLQKLELIRYRWEWNGVLTRGICLVHVFVFHFTGYILQNCKTSGIVNAFNKRMTYTVEEGRVLNGMGGIFRDHYK